MRDSPNARLLWSLGHGSKRQGNGSKQQQHSSINLRPSFLVLAFNVSIAWPAEFAKLAGFHFTIIIHLTIQVLWELHLHPYLGTSAMLACMSLDPFLFRAPADVVGLRSHCARVHLRNSDCCLSFARRPVCHRFSCGQCLTDLQESTHYQAKLITLFSYFDIVLMLTAL